VPALYRILGKRDTFVWKLAHNIMVNLSKIKYPKGVDSSFIDNLRARVREYFDEHQISRFGNAGMIWKTVFMLSLFFIPYGIMVSGLIQDLWMLLVGWILMGFGMAGIGLSIMHDANHRSYSRNQATNKFIGNILNLIGGFAPNWQIQHNTLHHGYTNVDGYDEDIDAGKVLRLSPSKPRYRVHRYQHIYAWFLYGLMTFTWVLDKDFSQLNRYRKEGLLKLLSKSYPRLLSELIFSKILYFSYILVIPLLVLPVAWWWILIMFFIMHFVGGFTLTIIFQSAHVVPTSVYPLPDKEGHLEDSWAIHQMKTTADFPPNSRIFSWYIGGLNYQVEHHLFPNICHVHYRKLSGIVREVAKEFGVPYHVQPSFVNAIRNHGKMLKHLGRIDM
jgi:linoleoyl-CoA desaturase